MSVKPELGPVQEQALAAGSRVAVVVSADESHDQVGHSLFFIADDLLIDHWEISMPGQARSAGVAAAPTPCRATPSHRARPAWLQKAFARHAEGHRLNSGLMP
jgi:hypothetical protein